MSKVSFSTSLGSTRSVDEKYVILAEVPNTRELRVTPSYAGQMLPGHRIVAALAPPESVAPLLVEEFRCDLESILLERQVEAEDAVNFLKAAVDALKASISARAAPFLDYLIRNEKATYHEARLIQESLEFGFELPEAFCYTVYQSLNLGKKQADVRNAILAYIKKGVVGEAFEALKGKVVGNWDVFGELSEAKKNAKDLGDSDSQLPLILIEKLREVYAGTEVSEASGEEKNESAEGTLAYRLRAKLEAITANPVGKPFLVDISEISEGDSQGFIVPFNYDPRNNNLPVEYGNSFISTADYGRMLVLIDGTLRTVLQNFSVTNGSLQLHSKHPELGDDPIWAVLMRASFPENHMPTRELYSDKRLFGKMGLALLEEVRPIIARSKDALDQVALEYFGMPAEEHPFSQLVELQAGLMQLLPFRVYSCAAANGYINSSAVKRAGNYDLRESADRLAAKRARNTEDMQLKRDFGTNFDEIASVRGKGADKAIGCLFGHMFSSAGFIDAEKFFSGKP